MMNFKTWITTYFLNEPGDIGVLSRAIYSDSKPFVRSSGYRTNKHCLLSRGATDEFMDMFEHAWGLYKFYKDHTKRRLFHA